MNMTLNTKSVHSVASMTAGQENFKELHFLVLWNLLVATVIVYFRASTFQ